MTTIKQIPHLGLNQMRVLAVDDLLHGGRHKDVTLLVHQVLALVRLRAREPVDRALLVAPVLQRLGVDSVLVVDGAIVLDDADAGGSRAGQVAARVQADVTKALHDVRLAAPAGRRADHAHVVGLVDKVLQAVEDTASGGGHAAVDTALVDWLAGDAGVGVDVGMADGLGVGVGDPGHFTLAGAHVGGGHIDAGPHEALLGQLEGEAARDLLQLVLRVLLGVDLDAGLGAAEWDIDAGALEGHEGGQGLDLVTAHVQGVTDS